MASIGQIHGMMLEEALLYLLQVSGYRTVESAVRNGERDPTLQDGHSGLEVLGRGGVHQIDAVADFVIAQPFSNPQRLLLEAKFRSKTTGIEVVRNAVGVLKDVGEYWVARNKVPPKARYHYQYAIFSASAYTSPAQKYAYAQDVYLIPLAKSAYFRPIINAIQRLNINNFNQALKKEFLSQLRKVIRENLRDSQSSTLRLVREQTFSLIDEFCWECRRLNGALIAMIAKQFPIFLVPNRDVRIDDLENHLKVEIYWNKEGWYLHEASSYRNIFSFDLPKELFNLYAEQGLLSEIRALNLKKDYLCEIQAIVMSNSQARVITFELDREWFDRLRDNLIQSKDEDEDIENDG